ncbi:MAG: DASS family sodium-coupled anion symporter, partial [Rhodothermales bacterium]
IATIGATTAPYANPLIFLFLGGFLIAAGMERWNLHRRLALRIIKMMGPRPPAILAGFAVAAAFLSMWVSNTATALMMLPIGLSVVSLVNRDGASTGEHFATALMLIIAYSCSIGGMATLIGTPPNAFFAGFMLESYDVTIAFAEWMQIGLPLTLIALPLMYVILTRVVYPIEIEEIPGGATFITSELAKMGSMDRAERMVAAVFVSAAVLWITRPLLAGVVPGLSDPGIAMAMGLLLFILPADASKGVFLLEWEDAERLPWGVLVLFGGGLSLAAAIDQTGLAAWLGTRTELIADWPLFLVILIVTAGIVFLTELTSNIATAAAFLPIVASVAVGLGHSPLTLAVPAVLAASSAFMLPVATPPNAIVYGGSYITIPKMARAGIVLNIVFVVLISVLSYYVLPLVSLG